MFKEWGEGIFGEIVAPSVLAEQDFKQGLGVDPADAAPIYIRNKIALKESER